MRDAAALVTISFITTQDRYQRRGLFSGNMAMKTPKDTPTIVRPPLCPYALVEECIVLFLSCGASVMLVFVCVHVRAVAVVVVVVVDGVAFT